MVRIIVAMTENINAVSNTSLAPCLSFWPLLLATSAERAVLTAKKTDKVMNFGWTVRPTAATAAGPIEDTIMVSIIPAREMKKDSSTAGQAIRIVSLIIAFLS